MIVRFVSLHGRRARRLSVAVVLLVAATAWVLGTDPVRAGGVSVAHCPSGKLGKVSAAYHDFADSHPEIALGGLTRLDTGFYAEAGRSWPPATSITCQTDADALQHPVVKTDGSGCPPDWRPFDIPVSIGPDATVAWGTFVPEGFYTRAVPTTAGEPGWVTLCRAPAEIAPLT